MGVFFSQDGKPFFSPDNQQNLEIVTDSTSGPRIVVDPNPSELLPNRYYQFGKVQSEVKILRLKSFSKDHVETYKGEFEIGPGGSVKFPGSIRWHSYPEFTCVGSIYKFVIENGIGVFIEFKQ